MSDCILTEFNTINDGQYLYILKGKTFSRKKCILSLTIVFVLTTKVDADQMPHLGPQS